MKASVTNQYKESIKYEYQQWALPFMFALKITVNNFFACCYSHQARSQPDILEGGGKSKSVVKNVFSLALVIILFVRAIILF